MNEQSLKEAITKAEERNIYLSEMVRQLEEKLK